MGRTTERAEKQREQQFLTEPGRLTGDATCRVEAPRQHSDIPIRRGGVQTNGSFQAEQASDFIAKSMDYEKQTCLQTPGELQIQIRSSLLFREPEARQSVGGGAHRQTRGSLELAAAVPEVRLFELPRLL